MDIFRVKMKMKSLQVAVVLLIYFSLSTEGTFNPHVLKTKCRFSKDGLARRALNLAFTWR